MSEPTGSDDAVFSMDPQKALWSLARQFVNGQRVIADLTPAVNTVKEAASDNPEADFDKTANQWLTEAQPSLAASMKVAIEVYETFGPGPTRIADPTEGRAIQQQVLRVVQGAWRANTLTANVIGLPTECGRPCRRFH